MGIVKYIAKETFFSVHGTSAPGCGRCVEVCPQGVFEMRDKRAILTDGDLCMECRASAENCDFSELLLNAGVGCASVIIPSLLTGSEPTCGCSDITAGSCC